MHRLQQSIGIGTGIVTGIVTSVQDVEYCYMESITVDRNVFNRLSGLV